MSKIVGHGGLKLFQLIKTKPISTFGVTGICNIKGIAQIRYKYWLQLVQGSNLEVVQNSLEMARKKNYSEMKVTQNSEESTTVVVFFR